MFCSNHHIFFSMQENMEMFVEVVALFNGMWEIILIQKSKSHMIAPYT